MLPNQLTFASVCNKSAPISKVMLVEGCVVDNVVVEDKFSKSQSRTFRRLKKEERQQRRGNPKSHFPIQKELQTPRAAGATRRPPSECPKLLDRIGLQKVNNFRRLTSELKGERNEVSINSSAKVKREVHVNVNVLNDVAHWEQ
ncbi:hypothetical protein BCON_0313g00050 [Botryotinia convoluta]|uniref:Uncharacterized protein n=1 Tax=Botryotinia convoluta TaxID=54673 RepID=A0A4Z1HP06_9HELO|nr:hypothetical protein BCON_0313g00050 [Botryotinia convoluta]